jgi:hypothetical protein
MIEFCEACGREYLYTPNQWTLVCPDCEAVAVDDERDYQQRLQASREFIYVEPERNR